MRSILVISAVLVCLSGAAQKANKKGPKNTTTTTTTAAPTALSYSSPNVFTIGTAIQPRTPMITGAVTSYVVSPTLPAGLAISSSTGIISGTPTATTALSTYTVTASNATGSTSFGVVITVNPAVVAIPAPSALSYSSPNAFTVGTAISPRTPVVTGTVTSYAVSPTLPAGLAISSSTGIISGTPTATTALSTYTVTASNATGSTSFGVIITVNPAVVAIPAPSALSYSSPNVFTAGIAISPRTPVVTGTVSSYAVSPTLPAGLAISSSTGVISGTPTATTALSTYTVTASNATGSTSFGVVITVNPAVAATTPPPASSATTTVTYSPLTSNFSNPERGFYKHTEVHSASYYPLNQTTLTGYRTNSNITLILRVFYLENFVNGPISSAYLTAMQTDFARIRAAGLKCIVRFAYADHNDPGVPHDASKAIILSHINQLTPILQSNSDVIAVMQAGFIGSWGEWYYTDNFGMSPTTTDYANRKQVLDALLAAVPNKMVQLRTPGLKQNTFVTTTALSSAQAFTNTNIARVGHHNDCFLASGSDYGTYSSITTQYPYLEQETKYLPMGGETCAVNAPRSECTTAVSEMKKFHWSYMNLDYNESVIAGFQNNGCFVEMQNNLGYRFEMVNGAFPTNSVAGTAMPVSITIKNTGFASPFNARTPYIILRNSVTNAEIKVALNSDPRLWNPATTFTITQNILLPANMPAGTYKLFLSLPDSDSSLSNRGEYSIRLANVNTWEATTGYNDLKHTVTVGNAVARVGDQKPTEIGQIAAKMTVYPVPASDFLTVEADELSKMSLSVFNSLGQKVSVPTSTDTDSRVLLNTQNLSTGVYFVTLTSGSTTETKRFMVRH